MSCPLPFLLSLLPLITSDLILGAFNIQTFGVSKYSNLTLRTHLVDIVTKYDVILIQEIRDKSETVIHNFLSDCQKVKNFSMVLGPRLGATSYKEQYAVLYDQGKVQVKKHTVYDDKEMIFARTPYVVHITALNAEKNKSLTLIGIHIDPDEVVQELDGLVTAHQWALANSFPSPTVLLGDFNADCSYLSEKKRKELLLVKDAQYTWLIDEDTTVADTDCAYDRFIVSGRESFERTEVDRFDMRLGIGQNMARKVSDHYPIRTVWVYTESEVRNESDSGVKRVEWDMEGVVRAVKGVMVGLGWKVDTKMLVFRFFHTN